MKAMELKVWVDGVQRIVCGVTEFTTCQEVVIALAQAIGKLKTTSYDIRNCERAHVLHSQLVHSQNIKQQKNLS